MIQLTTASKKILVSMFEKMPVSEKERFGRDLHVLWDTIITGDEQREFKITPQDIFTVVNEGMYVVPTLLFSK